MIRVIKAIKAKTVPTEETVKTEETVLTAIPPLKAQITGLLKTNKK